MLVSILRVDFHKLCRKYLHMLFLLAVLGQGRNAISLGSTKFPLDSMKL
jgi:hypothetical protein